MRHAQHLLSSCVGLSGKRGQLSDRSSVRGPRGRPVSSHHLGGPPVLSPRRAAGSQRAGLPSCPSPVAARSGAWWPSVSSVEQGGGVSVLLRALGSQRGGAQWPSVSGVEQGWRSAAVCPRQGLWSLGEERRGCRGGQLQVPLWVPDLMRVKPRKMAERLRGPLGRTGRGASELGWCFRRVLGAEWAV